MLAPREMQLMQRCLDELRSRAPGFRTRRSQLQMIAAVAHALAGVDAGEAERAAGAHLAVIEAGTGTGKTVGYLLPALVLAHLRGRTLVVSSSTVTLQEQLLLRDVPALVQHLPFPVSFFAAKGRRRFVCPVRLSQRIESTAPVRTPNGVEKPQGPTPAATQCVPDPCATTSIDRGRSPAMQWFAQLHEAFAARRWCGDRDAWPQVVPDAIWQKVSVDRQGCLGGSCPRLGECPFHEARRRGRDANLVIVNHDLLLATAGLDCASTLPDLGEALVVVDEAHGLSAKARERGASKHSVCSAGTWIAQLAKEGLAAMAWMRLPPAGETVEGFRAAALSLGVVIDALQEAVVRCCEFSGEQSAFRFTTGALPTELRMIGESLQEAAQHMLVLLQMLRDSLVERASADARGTQDAQRHLGTLVPHLSRLRELISTWELMLSDDAMDAMPVARWVQRKENLTSGDDFEMCAAPLSGGVQLRRLLWDRVGAAVMTSATLRACGDFRLFLEEAGLADYAGLVPIALASPFDYAQRATLHIPALRADPRDARLHDLEVASRLPGLLARQRGALVLFASARQMHAVLELLPSDVRDTVLAQGEFPRRELVALHRARIDRGGRSVLFGLASLAEGLDLPREYCSHVICTKLPFSVPADPVEQTRREWIEAQGRSAFLERSLPDVAVRLAQAAGRLLRTDEDQGVVTILDRRLACTRWGRRLLQGLPPFRIVIGDRGDAARVA